MGRLWLARARPKSGWRIYGEGWVSEVGYALPVGMIASKNCIGSVGENYKDAGSVWIHGRKLGEDCHGGTIRGWTHGVGEEWMLRHVCIWLLEYGGRFNQGAWNHSILSSARGIGALRRGVS